VLDVVDCFLSTRNEAAERCKRLAESARDQVNRILDSQVRRSSPARAHHADAMCVIYQQARLIAVAKGDN
jgi:hypothetical protein